MRNSSDSENGFALVATLFLVSILVSLLASYYLTAHIELATSKASRDSASGFYAAEAGLNIRAQDIRQEFIGYNRPTGVSPSSSNACTGSNMGTGSFQCASYAMSGKTAETYVEEEPGNPIITTIPPGELYQNLNAQEYRYTVKSRAVGFDNSTQALLELKFKSRLVPLFQFMAFYNKDLEILPGPSMTMNGPIHTNGDLYLNTNNSSPGLAITGQVTTAGNLYRGRKNDSTCLGNPVNIYNPLSPLALIPSCSIRTQIPATSVGPWNGMIRIGVDQLTVPPPESLDPIPGQIYWDRADLRLVLHLTAGNAPNSTNASTAVEVRNADNTLDATATNYVDNDFGSCSGAISGKVVGTTNTFYDHREDSFIRMLEVDVQGLLNCLHATNWFGTGKLLSDTSEGGLVFHFSVEGPNSATTTSRYAVRLRNGSALASSIGGSPAIQGLTIVTDQAIFVKGNYNTTNKKPAALMGDSLNILSNSWNFTETCTLTGTTCTAGTQRWSGTTRQASSTTINAAVLAGTDTTGGVEGTGGQGGAYNGGLENYPRLHEDWTGDTLTYLGSFVSLNTPRHVIGPWFYGNPNYAAPNRAWSYDTSFNNADNLPPLSPRFVYLKQVLFVRDFE